MPQHVKVRGGRCSYGGWQEGTTSKKKGCIRHYMHFHKQLKDEMEKTNPMKRIRAADTAALKVLRTKHGREELEQKRRSGKRKAKDLEESDVEEEELFNDLD